MVAAGGLPVAGVIAGAFGREPAGGTHGLDAAGAQLPGDGLVWKGAPPASAPRAAAGTAGTLVLGCRSSFISSSDWLIGGAGPGMNRTPLLSVIVDVVPVCRSDLLSWMDIGYLLFVLVG
jgi:hypothetical protein